MAKPFTRNEQPLSIVQVAATLGNKIIVNSGKVFTRSHIIKFFQGRRNLLIVKKRRTKCRSCWYYKRVKKGYWHEADWKSGAGYCSHPDFLLCPFSQNITGTRNLYRPKTEFIIVDGRTNILTLNRIPVFMRIIIIGCVNRHQIFIALWKKQSQLERLRADRKGKRPKPKPRFTNYSGNLGFS